MLENAPEQALDIEALLALSEEDLATLPSDVAGQAQELIAAHKEAAAQEAKEQQQRLTALGQRIVGVYHDRVGQRTELSSGGWRTSAGTTASTSRRSTPACRSARTAARCSCR